MILVNVSDNFLGLDVTYLHINQWLPFSHRPSQLEYHRLNCERYTAYLTTTDCQIDVNKRIITQCVDLLGDKNRIPNTDSVKVVWVQCWLRMSKMFIERMNIADLSIGCFHCFWAPITHCKTSKTILSTTGATNAIFCLQN